MGLNVLDINGAVIRENDLVKTKFNVVNPAGIRDNKMCIICLGGLRVNGMTVGETYAVLSDGEVEIVGHIGVQKNS